MVRCFRPKANAKGINLELRGPSRSLTYGPSPFDLVPYAIIDNAIKYAPANSSVDICVIDGVTDTRVKVRSLGPSIEPHEQRKIFEKGYRGKYAQRTPQPSGLGLAAAKDLLDEHFRAARSTYLRRRKRIRADRMPCSRLSSRSWSRQLLRSSADRSARIIRTRIHLLRTDRPPAGKNAFPVKRLRI
ncbi:hypothetical protein ABIF66_002927 [Bradyrhizobium japonicum]